MYPSGVSRPEFSRDLNEQPEIFRKKKNNNAATAIHWAGIHAACTLADKGARFASRSTPTEDTKPPTSCAKSQLARMFRSVLLLRGKM